MQGSWTGSLPAHPASGEGEGSPRLHHRLAADQACQLAQACKHALSRKRLEGAGVDRPIAKIEDEVVALVRRRIGPVASFKTALVVERLPKTRSGKILRGTMRRIADGEDYRMPATIDDPAILGEIGEALARAGYPQNK